MKGCMEFLYLRLSAFPSFVGKELRTLVLAFRDWQITHELVNWTPSLYERAHPTKEET